MPMGCLVAIEGIDGSGKTTLLEQIKKKYGEQNVFAIQSGGNSSEDVERYIKAILTDETKEMEEATEALLYLAGLSHKTRHHIIPALKQYKIVAVDRYALSTFVLIHFMDNVDSSTAKSLVSFATNGLMPNITFLCDVGATEAHRRLISRGEQLTKREKKGDTFYNLLRSGYKKYIKDFAEKYEIIDTEKTSIDNLSLYLNVLDDYLR